MGADRATSLCRYGNYWRLHRRLWAWYLGKKPMNDYSELMASEAKELALRLIDTKKNTFTETRLSFRSAFTNIAISYVPHH